MKFRDGFFEKFAKNAVLFFLHFSETFEKIRTVGDADIRSIVNLVD